MNKTITRRSMLTLMAAAVCAPALAVERTSGELKHELGIWILDSVERGLENEELMGAIRRKAKEILEKNGINLPHIHPEREEEEREKFERERQEAKDRKGPPPWAPAHGWRRKFGQQEERALGDYVTYQVAEGRYGTELVAIVRKQIEQVSKGGKVGDNPKGDEREWGKEEGLSNKPEQKKSGPPKRNGKYGPRR